MENVYIIAIITLIDLILKLKRMELTEVFTGSRYFSIANFYPSQ